MNEIEVDYTLGRSKTEDAAAPHSMDCMLISGFCLCESSYVCVSGRSWMTSFFLGGRWEEGGGRGGGGGKCN